MQFQCQRSFYRSQTFGFNCNWHYGLRKYVSFWALKCQLCYWYWMNTLGQQNKKHKIRDVRVEIEVDGDVSVGTYTTNRKEIHKSKQLWLSESTKWRTYTRTQLTEHHNKTAKKSKKFSSINLKLIACETEKNWKSKKEHNKFK